MSPRKTAPGAVLLIALLLPFILGAQAEPGEAEAPEKKKKNWNLALNAGLTLNSGNTSSKLFSGESKLELILADSRLQTRLEKLYGVSNQVANADSTRWQNHYSRKLGRGLNLSATLFFERDRFAEINLRTNAGLGLECRFQDTEERKSGLGITMNGEFLDSRGDVPDRKSLRFSLTYLWERKFNNNSRISISANYTPNLADLFTDYRLESRISLNLLMKEPLWLTVRLHERFNNQPLAPGIRKNDLTLITALEIIL